MLTALISCNRCRDNCIHGTCIKRLCDCDIFYEGDRCDRSILTAWEGAYAGTYTEFNEGVQPIAFRLTVDNADPTAMLSDTIGLNLIFETKTRFYIPRQLWRGVQVSGEGEMLVNAVSMRIDNADTSEEIGLIEAAREVSP